jgi:hypothetical protein
MKRKRRRLSKKKLEQLEREEAEKESKARSESEDRQEEIKVLWGLAEQQLGTAKNPKERKLKEKQLKAKKLTQLLKSVEDLTGNDDLVDPVRELIRLAALQDREIEYLMQFRRDWERIDAHYPDQLENLSSASLFDLRLFIETRLAEQNPNWEDRRHGYKLFSGVGLIEYQFGGAGEAEWQRHSLSGALGLPYEPTCLDKIFAGGRLKMHEREGEMMSFWSPGHRIREPGLQNLFGMHRNRFPKNLSPKEDGRETWYDYRAVVETMRALLLEKSGEAKGSARLWLRGDQVLRTRVLSGIAARIDSLSVSGVIARAFLGVVRQYPPDSAKK